MRILQKLAVSLRILVALLILVVAPLIGGLIAGIAAAIYIAIGVFKLTLGLWRLFYSEEVRSDTGDQSRSVCTSTRSSDKH